MNRAITQSRQTEIDVNKLLVEDRAIHDWYRFVLSFPPHLVRDYIQRFALTSNHCVLDPFCGTGTVLVECKKLGIPSVGIEAHPLAHFVSQTKTNWHLDPDLFLAHATIIADAALQKLQAEHIEDEPFFRVAQPMPHPLRTLPAESFALLLTNSISPLPLHKTLALLECIEERHDEHYYQHELLALAKALVYSFSNLQFGPEVGVGAQKTDVPVISTWLQGIRIIANDIRMYSNQTVPAEVHLADTRHLGNILAPHSIDAVITSPPYPNEKDYTRTTRLESVVLGLLRNKEDLQALKRRLLRSNTRNVYKGDSDDQWVATHLHIQQLAKTIEARRIELGKTSGFERLYGRVTQLYFGGMARHLQSLLPVLRPSAHLAYVVGDQASYLQVKIPTGQIIANIAQSLGYQLVGIDLFRTRFATATKEQLREEVVVLHKPAHTTIFAQTNALYSSKSARESAIDGSDSMSAPTNPQKANRYQQIMEHIFFSHYKEGDREVLFEREEMVSAAKALGIQLPKNLGDIPYSFRYRSTLPESIRSKAPTGEDWIIRSYGRARYHFVATTEVTITPNTLMAETKIPDATPGILTMYALGDEQALLAKLRYNRLVDIFTGVTCYSLQNHLRTTVPNIGQIETDEIYIGVDQRGIHYIFPVQAKGRKDRLGIVQIEQDFAMCAHKFPALICRAIAAQFIENDLIALFEFEESENGVVLLAEKHYRLVAPDAITEEDIQSYRSRPTE